MKRMEKRKRGGKERKGEEKEGAINRFIDVDEK